MKRLLIGILFGVLSLGIIGTAGAEWQPPTINDDPKDYYVTFEGKKHLYDGSMRMVTTTVSEIIVNVLMEQFKTGKKATRSITRCTVLSIDDSGALIQGKTWSWGIWKPGNPYNDGNYIRIDTNCDGIFDTVISPHDGFLVPDCFVGGNYEMLPM